MSIDANPTANTKIIAAADSPNGVRTRLRLGVIR